MFQAVENQFIKKSLTKTPIQEEDSIYSGEFSTEPEEVTMESEEVTMESEEVTMKSEEASIESWESGCTEDDELSCIEEDNGCIEEFFFLMGIQCQFETRQILDTNVNCIRRGFYRKRHVRLFPPNQY